MLIYINVDTYIRKCRFLYPQIKIFIPTNVDSCILKYSFLNPEMYLVSTKKDVYIHKCRCLYQHT